MTTLGKLIPSPRALLIFEAAARSGSCGAAAREFNVTQPSVSRNIAQLEDQLGVRLFVRSPAGLTLTDEGQVLHRAVAEGFGRMGEALREIAGRHARQDVVELSLSTAFVTHWFIPRMQAFYRDFPSVDQRIIEMQQRMGGLHCAIERAMRGEVVGARHRDYRLGREMPGMVFSLILRRPAHREIDVAGRAAQRAR